ncbi:MAG: ATP-binding protein [Bdellovibrionales bacterium]|nr:ATP-binding protein [Bdellovibrionales bacterium]
MFAVPFLYFTYHVKYYYRPDLVRRGDLLLKIVTIILSAAVLYRMTTIRAADRELMLLCLLHLAPLVLTLLIIWQGRGSMRRVRANAATSENRDGAIHYAPTPKNLEIEKLSWDDLVIETELSEELFTVINLLRDPKTAKKYGVEVPKGILLYGPPGTGKTTIAKVMANSAGMAFFTLKLDEVVSKWVGESEKNLSALFKAAQKHAPAVIFIDEIDSIGKSRGSGQVWAENLLNHLLQLVDGVIRAEGLYIIGATNRVELVDAALKRPGRLSKTIEVPLPDEDARHRLFVLNLNKLKIDDQVDLSELVSVTSGRSGADIKEICNRAGLNAFKRESIAGGKRGYTVTSLDLSRAVREVLK